MFSPNEKVKVLLSMAIESMEILQACYQVAILRVSTARMRKYKETDQKTQR